MTSYTEFERVFGGLNDRRRTTAADQLPGATRPAPSSPTAAGGSTSSRVFPFLTRPDPNDRQHPIIDLTSNNDPFASLSIGAAQASAVWRARWPGAAGNEITVAVRMTAQQEHRGQQPPAGVRPGAADRRRRQARTPIPQGPRSEPTGTRSPAPCCIVDEDTGQLGVRDSQRCRQRSAADSPRRRRHITLSVTVTMGDTRNDTYVGLELGSAHPRFIGEALRASGPAGRRQPSSGST